ncbi:hypothetical protein D0Y65_050960 [Glycine soja]|uniref:Uncharacterized protein n=1 Tax=Glycine soja TaxID=3848 RepID=A0A445FE58_GLYSO|nr:hypothetical protein D0Y65_050960 [Glycine soja]
MVIFHHGDAAEDKGEEPNLLGVFYPMPLRDRIASPGGFVYPLKSHEGHFYLRPCANDVIDIVTFLEHYLYHNSYLTPITSLFSISYILSNLGTWPRGFDPYYRWLKRVFATKEVD